MRYSLFSAGSNTVMQSPVAEILTRWNHQPGFPHLREMGNSAVHQFTGTGPTKRFRVFAKADS